MLAGSQMKDGSMFTAMETLGRCKVPGVSLEHVSGLRSVPSSLSSAYMVMRMYFTISCSIRMYRMREHVP